MPNTHLAAVFETLKAKYAAYYGVENVGREFSLNNSRVTASTLNPNFTPSKEIDFLLDVQSKSQFLQFVNFFTRSQKTGGSFKIGAQGRNTRTNDTKSGNERRVNDPKPPLLNEYVMKKAHFDFGLHDDDLSDMSEFPDWHQMYRLAQLIAYGDDIQIVGFHGTHHAATSDISTNPMLEDVNVGWLQLLKERNSSNVFTGNSNNEVHIGKGGHYLNLDQYIHDLYQAIPAHKRAAGMTATVGGGIMARSEAVYFADNAQTPSEKAVLQQKMITGVYGGLESIPANFLFDNAIMITNLKRNGAALSNLSVYTQRDSMKRSIEYVPKLERTVDWNACWRAYHIEDLNRMVSTDVEKVVYLDIKDANGKPVEVLKKPVGEWADL